MSRPLTRQEWTDAVAKGWSDAMKQTQEEQKPVAYTNGIDVILAKHWAADYQPEGWEPLGYTTPPQRTWVGLTPDEVFEVFGCKGTADSDVNAIKILQIAEAMDAKLKEKNNVDAG